MTLLILSDSMILVNSIRFYVFLNSIRSIRFSNFISFDQIRLFWLMPILIHICLAFEYMELCYGTKLTIPSMTECSVRSLCRPLILTPVLFFYWLTFEYFIKCYPVQEITKPDLTASLIKRKMTKERYNNRRISVCVK